jgi:hypothetical protein
MFDSLNTTGGHIFVCMLIALGGGVLIWMGRTDMAIYTIGVGLVQTGIGVAFRSMGLPSPTVTPTPTATVTEHKERS